MQIIIKIAIDLLLFITITNIHITDVSTSQPRFWSLYFDPQTRNIDCRMFAIILVLIILSVYVRTYVYTTPNQKVAV